MQTLGRCPRNRANEWEIDINALKLKTALRYIDILLMYVYFNKLSESQQVTTFVYQVPGTQKYLGELSL